MEKDLFDTEFYDVAPYEDDVVPYEEEAPLYNRHYITTRTDGAIIDAWSDGPHPEKDTANAICINEQGGYQLRLILNGEPTEENPPIFTDDGIPLYKWDGSQVIPGTKEEIEADRAAIPAPPHSAQEQLRADVDFIAAMTGVML